MTAEGATNEANEKRTVSPGPETGESVAPATDPRAPSVGPFPRTDGKPETVSPVEPDGDFPSLAPRPFEKKEQR